MVSSRIRFKVRGSVSVAVMVKVKVKVRVRDRVEVKVRVSGMIKVKVEASWQSTSMSWKSKQSQRWAWAAQHLFQCSWKVTAQSEIKTLRKTVPPLSKRIPACTQHRKWPSTAVEMLDVCMNSKHQKAAAWLEVRKSRPCRQHRCWNNSNRSRCCTEDT